MSTGRGRGRGGGGLGGTHPPPPPFDTDSDAESIDGGRGGVGGPGNGNTMFRFSAADDRQLCEIVHACMPFEQPYGRTEDSWDTVAHIFNAYLREKGDTRAIDLRRAKLRFKLWMDRVAARDDAYRKMMERMNDPAQPHHREEFREVLRELYNRFHAAPEVRRALREAAAKQAEDVNDSGLAELLSSSMGGTQGAAAACPDRAAHGQPNPPRNVRLTSPLGSIPAASPAQGERMSLECTSACCRIRSKPNSECWWNH